MKTPPAPRTATSPSDVLTVVAEMPPGSRRAVESRLATLAPFLSTDASTALTPVELVAEVGAAADLLWLSYAVLAARLPTDEEMEDVLVAARLHGSWTALEPVLEEVSRAKRHRSVEVVQGAVTCDVHTTAESDYLSGIQRVVRETTRRWHTTHEVVFLGWTPERTALRRLRETQRRRLLGETDLVDTPAGTVLVPWECTHLSVEVVDQPRATRLMALGQHSRNEFSVLGYDSIPITSSRTVDEGTVAFFSRVLAANRRADRVAMISQSAAEEFRGVLAMGAGRRDHGPEVTAVPLPVEAAGSSDADLAEAAAGLVVDDLPMLLVVGSHEPRKNHLAVLHAAEVLWREGVRFSLVLVGAGGWNTATYEATVGGLIGSGRPVQSIRGLPDHLLWAAYRLAHCVVFPSLNEGFGLPVAEALAVGTPVVTSDFGSMRDLVAPDGEVRGGLLVDPRDDDSLVAALRTVVTDEAAYARLREQAAACPTRTWDEYAEELWTFLVHGERTTGGAGASL